MTPEPADAPLRPLATALQCVGVFAIAVAGLRYLERHHAPDVLTEAERAAERAAQAAAEALRRRREGD